MTDRTDAARRAIEDALADSELLESFVEALSGASRRSRQQAASVLAAVSHEDPSKLTAHVSAFSDALNRPEAQTRWECLDVLARLVDFDAAACEAALDGAESSLFDEESGPARLAALRFLCRLGLTSEARAEAVWPLLDEAIQCYHGDLEFSDMLLAITEFSLGDLPPSVKAALAERMKFDAANAKGPLKARAAQIVANVGA